MRKTVATILAIAWIGISSPGVAQETREAQIAVEQAEKAKHLHPYEPTRAELMFIRLTRGFIETPSGFYPSFGSVYGGGGFTLGVGYRRFYGDRALWNARGLYSVRSYKLVELSTESPGHAKGRLDLFAQTGWRDATQVAFYGLGMSTAKGARTNFRMEQATISAGLRARPVSWTVGTFAASYEDFTIGNGTGTKPAVQQVHSPATAPGLGGNPKYLHSAATAGIDWRPSEGYARRGGLYEIGYHNYTDLDNVYGFDRLDGEVVQHIPILRENWVVSLRGRVQTSLDNNDVVPYFLLPSLGSGSTLRGYSSWRFRDRHSELFSVEWRWIPSRFALDMAIFYDAGKVTSRRSDLGFNGLKGNVGIGARFHGPAATPLRIELARGQEGLNLVFSGGPAF
jgi:hypothetical protein